MGQLVFQATLGGQVNLVGPNTASTYNINVPAVAGNMVTTGDTGTVTNTMLASSAYTAPGTIGSGTPNTGAFTTLSGSTSLTTPIVKSATTLSLQTNGSTTAVTIDASQNVGIGTTSPTTKLQIVQTGGNFAVGSAFTKVENTTGASASLILADTTDSFTLKNIGSALAFIGSSTERARIDTSGNLLVGTTTQLSNGKTSVYQAGGGCAIEAQIVGSGTAFAVMTARVNNTANLLHAFYYNNYSANVGSISTNGTVTAYNISSDYRLKENIVLLTGALDKITQLKPSVYNYKSKPEEAIEGFIAHELAEVVPHAVTGEKDAVDVDGNPVYQGVDASFLIPHLVAAIQELNAKITALENK